MIDHLETDSLLSDCKRKLHRLHLILEVALASTDKQSDNEPHAFQSDLRIIRLQITNKFNAFSSNNNIECIQCRSTQTHVDEIGLLALLQIWHWRKNDLAWMLLKSTHVHTCAIQPVQMGGEMFVHSLVTTVPARQGGQSGCINVPITDEALYHRK